MNEGIQALKYGLLFTTGKGNTNDFGGGWVSSEIIETHCSERGIQMFLTLLTFSFIQI